MRSNAVSITLILIFDSLYKFTVIHSTWINNHPNEIVPVAFDMEWPFSFQTGPGKSSVIQLCADTTECYVFHLSKLNKLPKALLELVTCPKILLHGVNIKNDCRKLQRDFPEANSDKMIERCRDLGVWSIDVLDTSGRWSLERLVQEIVRIIISNCHYFSIIYMRFIFSVN